MFWLKQSECSSLLRVPAVSDGFTTGDVLCQMWLRHLLSSSIGLLRLNWICKIVRSFTVHDCIFCRVALRACSTVLCLFCSVTCRLLLHSSNVKHKIRTCRKPTWYIPKTCGNITIPTTESNLHPATVWSAVNWRDTFSQRNASQGENITIIRIRRIFLFT